MAYRFSQSRVVCAIYAFTSYDNVGHIVKIPEDYFALYCRLTLDIESLEMYSSAYYNKPS